MLTVLPEPSPFVVALHTLHPKTQEQLAHAVGRQPCHPAVSQAQFLLFHLPADWQALLWELREPGMVLHPCVQAPEGYAPPLELTLPSEQVLRWLVGLERLQPVFARLLRSVVTPQSPARSWSLPRKPLTLERPQVMAIVNVTPDSFFDGGRYQRLDQALVRAEQAEAEGADLLDVGGESTRPGAAIISEEEELRRVMPVIEALAKRTSLPLSVDTTKAEVARRAMEAGAQIINDISGGLADPKMPSVLRQTGAACVLMHMRGTPQTMQQHTRYFHLLSEVLSALSLRVEWLTSLGVERSALALDPGIGFAKEAQDNVVMLNQANMLHCLGLPVLVGASRKSFLGKLFGLLPEERLEGSLAAALLASLRGVQLLRVHDVKASRRALDVFKGLLEAY